MLRLKVIREDDLKYQKSEEVKVEIQRLIATTINAPIFNEVNRYIVGKSSIDSLEDAVKLEYEHEILPLVIPTKQRKGNIRNTTMEAYARLLLTYAMNKLEKGKITRCPDACK